VRSLDHASTTIQGLDAILGGGLPRDRIYLLKGAPGTGKTTLALQFLLAGAARGETGLYITLSETREELRGVVESHGWSLDQLAVFELEHGARACEQYTMYHASEVELERTMEKLLAEVRRVKPTRVVFDSLSEIRLLAEEPLRYRRQILDLKQHFAGTECTVLLLDDYDTEADNHLESLAHGVIALQRHAPSYGGARRRLEVVKLRGVKFSGGFHDFTIERGGLEVYPRLVAAQYPPSSPRGRLLTGVVRLDQMLGGGLDYGTATLLLGPAGSGKSALAGQCAVAAANAGHAAAIFTFDESTGTLFARADALGMPLRAHADAGKILVQQIDPAEMSPGRFVHIVQSAVEASKARVIVIDSLTGYLNAMPEERYLLDQLHELLTYLGHQGVITLLVATQHGLIGTSMLSPVDVSYLADTVILFRYFEARGRVTPAVSVLKKRTGAHERVLCELSMSDHGIEVGDALEQYHGVLTGVPSHTKC